MWVRGSSVWRCRRDLRRLPDGRGGLPRRRLSTGRGAGSCHPQSRPGGPDAGAPSLASCLVSRRIPSDVSEQARLRLLALWADGPSPHEPIPRPPEPLPTEPLPTEPLATEPGWLPLDPVLQEASRHQPAAPPVSQDSSGQLSRGRRPATRSARLTLAERLPPGLRGALLAAERPAVSGLALVGLATVAMALVIWAMGRPHAEAIAPRVQATGASPAAGSEDAGRVPVQPSPVARVVVDVVGLVRRPGVVTLASGSRVVDALRAAGGATAAADLSAVNLARRLVDGEQIVVVAPGVKPPVPVGAAVPGGSGGAGSGGSTGSGSAAAAGPLDLNAATLQDLDQLPGVGPVLAQRILDWRQAHGRFSSVDELHEVTGIGSARYDDLSTLVRV